MEKKRLIIGISGASGAPLAVDLLKEMKRHDEWETHLVISEGAEQTIEYETGLSVQEVKDMADVVYDLQAIGAAIASGTFHAEGMIVVPCSMRTLAGIASGYAENLLLRAADVMLKQRRKLILAVRETPFSLIHIRNMETVTLAGAIVMPAMMTYYTKPGSAEEMTHHLTCKLLDEFGIEAEGFRRWS